jgi:hypothetical protein
LRKFVANMARLRSLTKIALSAGLACAGVANAQESSAPPPPASATQESLPAQAPANVTAPCEQPAPMPGMQDYDGPLAKVVGTFTRKLERKSVHPPHYKPGVTLCTLKVKDKFILFLQDSVDPITFLSAGFDAGIDQAQNNDHSYGQGAAGYGKRFGANYAGEVSSEFFKVFAYPTIFSEDPRYYRMAHGSAGKRLFHALEHSVVAYNENGGQMFNASEWFGTTSAMVLSNTYHPDNRRGVARAAERVGYSVLSDMGYDVLREFWPEIARKFRLPFRDQNEPNPQTPVPAN